MQVIINGEATSLKDDATVDSLIEHLGIEGRIAVEINCEIVPRSRFASHQVREGDIIEIVHAIGGG